MDLTTFFGKFHLDRFRIGPGWANVDIALNDEDRAVAWELYVEPKYAFDKKLALLTSTSNPARRLFRGVVPLQTPVVEQFARIDTCGGRA